MLKLGVPSGTSLREEVSRGANGNHFGHIDEEMYYRMFNRRSLPEGPAGLGSD